MADSDAAAKWQKFLEMPGTHLSFRRFKWTTWGLVDDNVKSWARCHYGLFGGMRWAEVRNRQYRWRTAVGYSLYRDLVDRSYRRGQEVRELIDVTTGKGILTMSGYHFGHRANTRVTMSNGAVISLPVIGTRSNNATMVAIDEGGTALIRYRLNSGSRWWWPYYYGTTPKRTEVIVTAQGSTVPHIEALVAATVDCLISYLRNAGGGG